MPPTGQEAKSHIVQSGNPRWGGRSLDVEAAGSAPSMAAIHMRLGTFAPVVGRHLVAPLRRSSLQSSGEIDKGPPELRRNRQGVGFGGGPEEGFQEAGGAGGIIPGSPAHRRASVRWRLNAPFY